MSGSRAVRGWAGGQLRVALMALRFLTRVPCPVWVGDRSGDLACSTVYFPVVGLVVGAGVGMVYAGAHLLWPDPVAVALMLAFVVWGTGAFHEDALADAADGFGGGWDRARILGIMKDSRIGSYGTVAVTLMLLGKFAALIAIAGGGPAAILRASVAAHVLARWSSLPLMHRYPYAREDGGTGQAFAQRVTTRRLVVASAMALVIVVVALGVRVVAAIPVAGILTVLSGRYAARHIGGITGDCLGATNQLVEIAVYLVAAAALPGGVAPYAIGHWW